MDSTPLRLQRHDFSPLPTRMASGLFTLVLHVLLLLGLCMLVQPTPAALNAHIEVHLVFSAASPATGEQAKNVIPESAAAAPAKPKTKPTSKAGPKKQAAATQKNGSPANSAAPGNTKGEGNSPGPPQAQGFFTGVALGVLPMERREIRGWTASLAWIALGVVPALVITLEITLQALIAAVVIGDNRLGFFICVVQTFRITLFCFIQSVKDQVFEINFHVAPALFSF